MLRRSSLVLLTLALTGCASTFFHSGVSSGHPAAMDVPLGEARLRQIHPHVWVHVSTWQFGDGTVFPANGLIVRDGGSVILIDSAWGEEATASLLTAVEAQIGLPVRTAVVTHFHDDRVSGVRVLESRGVTVYGTPLTRELVEANKQAVPSTPLLGLSESGNAVSVGSVEVFYPGAGHSSDNLVVYVPEAAVLFGGCAVHEAARETAGNVRDADLRSWPFAIRRVQERYPDAKIIVPGHGVPGGPELLDHTISVVEAHGDS